MKKVFLSLAVVAVLTVVSCKKADAPAADATAVDSTAGTFVVNSNISHLGCLPYMVLEAVFPVAVLTWLL